MISVADTSIRNAKLFTGLGPNCTQILVQYEKQRTGTNKAAEYQVSNYNPG